MNQTLIPSKKNGTKRKRERCVDRMEWLVLAYSINCQDVPIDRLLAVQRDRPAAILLHSPCERGQTSNRMSTLKRWMRFREDSSIATMNPSDLLPIGSLNYITWARKKKRTIFVNDRMTHTSQCEWFKSISSSSFVMTKFVSLLHYLYNISLGISVSSPLRIRLEKVKIQFVRDQTDGDEFF